MRNAITRYIVILIFASIGFVTEVVAKDRILSWDGEAAAKLSSSVVRLRDGPNGEVIATISTETLRRLVEVKDRIAAAANQPAHLYILSGTEPNAMALKKDGSPKIAINVAMIELLGDDYDAYAAIIGHELAHLVRDHGATRQSREGARNAISSILGTILGRYGVPLGGAIANFSTTAVSRTFSRDEEREADSLGLGYMKQAGYDPMGGVRAWERMGVVAKSRGLPFLSTHPAPDERLETMRKLAQDDATFTQSRKSSANVDAIAFVNGQPIPKMAVELIVQAQLKTGQKDTPEQRSAIKDHLITLEIVAQSAAEIGLPDARTSAEIRNSANAQSYLALVNKGAHAYRVAYLRAHPVDETEARTEYERLKEQLSEKEYKARHILVEKEDEAREIIEKLKKGDKFEELAKVSKDSGSKDDGGELEWNLSGGFVEPFSDAMVKLEKGKYTETPVQSALGWHVIRLDDVRHATLPDFYEVKLRLQRRMQRQMFDKAVTELRAKAKIQ